MNDAVRRLNHLASINESSSYLEIGVFQGDTFLNVEVAEKVGVDPDFKFDIAPHQSAKSLLVPKTSDQFFEELDPEVVFDLIYIDGLHTFEQTYRDFCNALMHSHSQTIILIDDVYPTDPFGIFPTQEIAKAERAKLGIVGWAWWGDVFKINYMIHDFHPALNYALIDPRENAGQLAVWFEGKSPRRPIFNSIEAITRLDYLGFLNTCAKLNPAAEEIAFEMVTKDFSLLKDS